MHIATPACCPCHEARPGPHAGVSRREHTQQARSAGGAAAISSRPRLHRVARLCRATVRRIRSDRELPDDDDDDAVDALASRSRRSHLLAYVEAVQPSVMDSFSTQASQEVLDAMRSTVTNLVGSLPPQWFSVTVSSLSENLAQLLFSTLMTGYVFRNLSRRRELKRVLAGTHAGSGGKTLPPFAGLQQQGVMPTQQRDVHGMVVLPDGKHLVSASAYIVDLESEVVRLRDELAAVKRGLAGHNGLLDDLQTLEPANLAELTSSADAEVLDAMNAFVRRLVDVDSTGGGGGARSTTSVPELARLLSWALVVGYSLRANQEEYDVAALL